jgi:hypothetical protein
MEVWIKADNPSSGRQMIMGEGGNCYNSAGYGLYANDGTTGKPRQHIRTGNIEDDQVIATNAIADNDLHHIVGVWDGTEGELQIYVDGIAATPVTGSFTQLGNAYDGWRIGGSGPLMDLIDGNSGYYFDGVMDEVRVSDIVREPDWIGALYRNQNNPEGYLTIGEEQ